jgi:hypothetical protein
MKLKVEAIAAIVPSVRAEIARELVYVHKLNQQEVSSLLGVSQPAVSQYIRELRGSRYREDFVRKEVSAICDKLIKGARNELEEDIYNLCRMIVENKSRR